jgi:hypothetical protein
MNHFEQPGKLHQELNPVLWTNGSLEKPVQVALLRIAKAYWKFLNIDTPIIDIIVSGSQANYNYSEHSDIDLHLVVDYSKVQCDLAVDELFKTKRDLWREEHDIDIHGIPVEVYVEDVHKPAVSSTYSLLTNSWKKEPKKTQIEPDSERIERLCKAWMILIAVRLATKDLAQIRQVKDMLWQYRKKGLDVEGEMGVPNLVFKTLRNSGVTDMLLAAVSKLSDLDLSLEDQY